MNEPVGLRERKKLRTRRALSEAAITLFLERGYDDVSVAEIAAVAEVSTRTLFAYFRSTKRVRTVHGATTSRRWRWLLSGAFPWRYPLPPVAV